MSNYQCQQNVDAVLAGVIFPDSTTTITLMVLSCIILYNMNAQVPVVCWNKVAPHRGCVVPQGMELVAQPGTWRTWDITALLESILTVRFAFRLPVNWEVVVAATIGGPDQRPVSPCCAAGPLFAGPPPSETVCTLRYCSSNSRCISKSAWRSRFNRCCS
jgi:hypothetical protein